LHWHVKKLKCNSIHNCVRSNIILNQQKKTNKKKQKQKQNKQKTKSNKQTELPSNAGAIITVVITKQVRQGYATLLNTFKFKTIELYGTVIIFIVGSGFKLLHMEWLFNI